jgi:hypothetical protein
MAALPGALDPGAAAALPVAGVTALRAVRRLGSVLGPAARRPDSGLASGRPNGRPGDDPTEAFEGAQAWNSVSMD